MKAYRPATVVFLAAAKRLYFRQPDPKVTEEDINDIFYGFVPPEISPVGLNLDTASILIDAVQDRLGVYQWLRNKVEDSYVFENTYGSINLAHTYNWRPTIVRKQIEAIETENGLKLRLHHEDYIEEISYRGDYVVEWESNESA